MDFDLHFATPEVMEMAINIVSEEVVAGQLKLQGSGLVQRIHEVLGMIIDMPETLDPRSVMAGACVYAAQQKAVEVYRRTEKMMEREDQLWQYPDRQVEGKDKDGLEKE